MADTSEHVFRDPSRSVEERVADLLSTLTLDEKISEMVHLAAGVPRLGIPPYRWNNECLHGLARAGIATVFPQAIALAATFDVPLMETVASVISEECRAKHHALIKKGVHSSFSGLTFWSPNINIVRDPRWGRGQETYGECPYLTGRMGVAFIRGLQGDDPKYLKVSATAKHYAVHSGPDGKRHFFDAQATMKDLHETYLPAFRACVIEGQVNSVMGAYNRLNGEVCCANPYLFDTVLRGAWGFKGHIVSDCGAISYFHEYHKVTKDAAESSAKAVKAGCDLNCGPTYPALKEAVERGLVSEDEIDVCLGRLFETRIHLGQFDPPEDVPHAQIPYEKLDCQAHREVALEAARKSLVLLKNDKGMLPLSRESVKTIAVIGPNADNPEALWANYNGEASNTVTPLEGIRELVGDGTGVLYQPGCPYRYSERERDWEMPEKYTAEAVLAAERSDVVVMCMGLSPEMEGEVGDATGAEDLGDRKQIALPPDQQALLEAIMAVGKPVILVVISGSCVELSWAQEQVPGIIQQFYPGEEGGRALAEALFGAVNPAGRLPVTVYRDLKDLPDFEDYSMANRTYRFFTGRPLYPFGFGLSYSRFEYEEIELASGAGDGSAGSGGSSHAGGSGTTVTIGDAVDVVVRVKNTSDRDGDEVVQLYLTRRDASSRVPVRQLVGFARVPLKAGQSQQATFTIEPRQMAVVQDDGQFVVEPGRVELYAGGSQPDSQSKALGSVDGLSCGFELVGDSMPLPM